MPELAFLQLCARQKTIEAAELGMQLTGTYRRLTPKEAPVYTSLPHASMSFYPRGSTPATCTRATAYNLRPLTNVTRLTAFLQCLPGAYGIKLARQALPLVREGLRSPFEAELFMRCFLSRKWGGLGVKEPVINKPLALTGHAAILAGSQVIVPDFWWPANHVVLEALGKRDHDSEDGITDTSRREKAYRALGITCFTITMAEMRNTNELITLMVEVCKELGYSFPRLTDATRNRIDQLNITLMQIFNGPHNQPETEKEKDDNEWFKILSKDIDTYGRL